MRVLLFSQYYPPETGALAARSAAHTRRWARAGADVTVVCGTPNYPTGRVPGRYRGGRVADERLDGVRVLRAPVVPTGYRSGWRRAANYLSYALGAAATAHGRAGRPDVVLGSSPPLPAALAGAVLAARHRVPFVLEIRDLWPDSVVGLGVSRPPGTVAAMAMVARWLYRRADRIVVVTPGMRDALCRRGVPGARVAVVPNGVDLDSFHQAVRPAPLRERHGLGPAPLVGHVGTVGLGQDLETFVRAMARLDDGDRAHAVIVGDGVRRDAVGRLARERAPGRFTFLGSRPHREVPALLAAFDVVLVSTAWRHPEAPMIPSKLYEAMACGKPVLLTGSGEAAALVQRAGVGRALLPGDPTALATALAATLDDRVLRRRARESGPAWVAAHHDRDRLAARLLAILEETC